MNALLLGVFQVTLFCPGLRPTPPVSTTPAAIFSTSFSSVIDNVANSVIDTGGKLATGVNNTGGK